MTGHWVLASFRAPEILGAAQVSEPVLLYWQGKYKLARLIAPGAGWLLDTGIAWYPLPEDEVYWHPLFPPGG